MVKENGSVVILSWYLTVFLYFSKILATIYELDFWTTLVYRQKREINVFIYQVVAKGRLFLIILVGVARVLYILISVINTTIDYVVPISIDPSQHCAS